MFMIPCASEEEGPNFPGAAGDATNCSFKCCLTNDSGFFNDNQKVVFLLCLFLTLFSIILYVTVFKKLNFKIMTLSVTEFLIESSFKSRFRTTR